MALRRRLATGLLLAAAAVVLLRGGTLRVSRRLLASCFLIGCLLPGANAILFFAERNVPTGLASAGRAAAGGAVPPTRGRPCTMFTCG